MHRAEHSLRQHHSEPHRSPKAGGCSGLLTGWVCCGCFSENQEGHPPFSPWESSSWLGGRGVRSLGGPGDGVQPPQKLVLSQRLPARVLDIHVGQQLTPASEHARQTAHYSSSCFCLLQTAVPEGLGLSCSQNEDCTGVCAGCQPPGAQALRERLMVQGEGDGEPSFSSHRALP